MEGEGAKSLARNLFLQRNCLSQEDDNILQSLQHVRIQEDQARGRTPLAVAAMGNVVLGEKRIGVADPAHNSFDRIQTKKPMCDSEVFSGSKSAEVPDQQLVHVLLHKVFKLGLHTISCWNQLTSLHSTLRPIYGAFMGTTRLQIIESLLLQLKILVVVLFKILPILKFFSCPQMNGQISSHGSGIDLMMFTIAQGQGHVQ